VDIGYFFAGITRDTTPAESRRPVLAMVAG